MKQYRVTAKATFTVVVSATDEDAAAERADLIDTDEMTCTDWGITDVEELDD